MILEFPLTAMVQVRHNQNGESIYVEEYDLPKAIDGLEQTLAKMREVSQKLTPRETTDVRTGR